MQWELDEPIVAPPFDDHTARMIFPAMDIPLGKMRTTMKMKTMAANWNRLHWQL
jgi:hypothetical protein